MPSHLVNTRGQVGARIGRERQRGALAHVQVDAAPEVNRAREEAPGRHDDAPAADGVTRVDGRADGGRAVGDAVTDGAVTRDVDVAVGEGRRHDAGEDVIDLAPRVGRSRHGWLREQAAGCDGERDAGTCARGDEVTARGRRQTRDHARSICAGKPRAAAQLHRREPLACNDQGSARSGRRDRFLPVSRGLLQMMRV